ncbi:unnamed protein product [Rhodiola kirilowii]
MASDLFLKPSCSGCGASTELYGSNCKHMTLCLSCGKSKVENKFRCYDCGTAVTRLIREYNVRATQANDKHYFIGRFVPGLPKFSKKKNTDNKWLLQKDGLQGRQVTDGLREKFKNKPWLLEDETGQSQYQGQLEGAQSATYYLLMMQGKEFVAIPAGSWYNFNKVAQYKQLTLEEAEEKMKNRRKTADGYERWMMKAANNGPAAFGEVVKLEDKESGTSSGKGRKKASSDDPGNASDNGDEDEEEEADRKNRLGLNKRKGEDDDEEGPRGGDFDLDDDDIEKGDDWEHEEIFTDDDEAVGNDPEEREDLAPEVPAPPEIKDDDEDEDENNEEEGGGLSKSGKELKKLLGKAAGMNESDADDDDDDDDVDDEAIPSSDLTPKKEAKEEPADNSPSKSVIPGAAKGGTPTNLKSTKGKRKLNGDDSKTPNTVPPKKVKTESETRPSLKTENGSSIRSVVPSTGQVQSTEPVSEEEIRAVIVQRTPITTQELVAKFKARLKTSEEKKAFAEILRRISKIQKTGGPNYVVLKERA